MKRIAILVAVALASGVVSYAAQQKKPTNTFALKNPSGTDNTKRRLLFKSKEGPGSTNTVVGNPTANGAKLHVRVGSNNAQCFDLPATGWSAIGPLGFRYKDFNGPEAVTAGEIKKTPSGVFFIKLRVSGRVGPLNVLPQAGADGFDLNLSLGGGDQYCAGGPTPAGATSTDKVYKAKNVPAPASCGLAACSPSGAFLD